MIEIIENLDGSLTKIEKVGDSVTSYMPLFAGVKKSRTLEDGTEETYSPYDELTIFATNNNIKIKKKTAKEKKELKKQEDKSNLKQIRDNKLQTQCFYAIPNKGTIGVAKADHRFDLYLASINTEDTDWVMVDDSISTITPNEAKQAFDNIEPIYRAIWKEYTDGLKLL